MFREMKLIQGVYYLPEWRWCESMFAGCGRFVTFDPLEQAIRFWLSERTDTETNVISSNALFDVCVDRALYLKQLDYMLIAVLLALGILLSSKCRWFVSQSPNNARLLNALLPELIALSRA